MEKGTEKELCFMTTAVFIRVSGKPIINMERGFRNFPISAYTRVTI